MDDVERRAMEALDAAGFTVHDLKLVSSAYEVDNRPTVDMETGKTGNVVQVMSPCIHTITCRLSEAKGSPTECRSCGNEAAEPNYMMRDSVGYVCRVCVAEAQRKLKGGRDG